MKLKDGTMETRLSRYLMTYRVTPHSTMGSSLSELLMGHKLQTLMDTIRYFLASTVKFTNIKKKLLSITTGQRSDVSTQAM